MIALFHSLHFCGNISSTVIAAGLSVIEVFEFFEEFFRPLQRQTCQKAQSTELLLFNL